VYYSNDTFQYLIDAV